MNEDEKPQLTEDERKLFEDLMPEDLNEILDTGVDRRHFLKLMTLAGGGILAAQSAVAERVFARPHSIPSGNAPLTTIENGVDVSFRVNGAARKLTVDSRMTLLDTLRERLELTGSKKGCDHGQCGACTVIVDGQRVLSCLTLAASCEGRSVKTIEGVARENDLHPIQAALRLLHTRPNLLGSGPDRRSKTRRRELRNRKRSPENRTGSTLQRRNSGADVGEYLPLWCLSQHCGGHSGSTQRQTRGTDLALRRLTPYSS